MNAIRYDVYKVTYEGHRVLYATRGSREEAMNVAQIVADDVHANVERLSELPTARFSTPTWRGTRVDMHGLHDYYGCQQSLRAIEVVRVIDYDALPFKVIFAGDPMPTSVTSSIFLAGPTPRTTDVPSWRPDAIEALYFAGYVGTVFVPEPREQGNWPAEYLWQLASEEEGLHRADKILFWVPRNMSTMPALTTNIEFGVWADSGKALFGAPPGAESVRYLQHYAEEYKLPIADNLVELVRRAVEELGAGARREGGECCVPLHVWKTASFQAWYSAQKAAGNRLDGARVVWTFRVGPKRNFVFFWALHANVWVGSEGRAKTNEVVLSRPDIATIVLHGPKNGPSTRVVLIREFRTPAATGDGFVHEVAGGSSWKPVADSRELAAHEVEEETGIRVDPSRVRSLGSRQMVATLSAHKAHAFAVELTDEELDRVAVDAGVHGVEEDTERTYVEVTTVDEIVGGAFKDKVDWAMVGMLFSAFHG